MRAALLAAAATASAVRPIDAAPRRLAAKTGPEAPAWCTTSRVRSEAEPPRFAFVRGFGGTGTGLLARVLGTHTRISTMTHTTAMYEDEGQYLQSAMPEIRKRTAESCGGSIAVCPRIVDTLPRDARVNVCAGWAPWWDATKDVLVEKTPDLALAALSAIFPARYEAAAIVVLRHPYFWHHKRHCPSHDAGCLLARVPRPRRLCVASTASTTQDAWIGAIKGALAPAMPLRLIVVRYEDLVLRTPEVSRALFAALNLPPTSRRRLALRGATTSPEHLWAFSAHAGGQPYAAAVHKCLADPRFTADVGQRLRGPLLAATGYDALRVDGADFVPLDTDLLASSLGPRFRAWLRSPATNRAAAMPPCASDAARGATPKTAPEALASRFRCDDRMSEPANAWRWAELANASWSGTHLEELAAVKRALVGSPHARTAGRTICRLTNVLWTATGPRLVGTAYRGDVEREEARLQRYSGQIESARAQALRKRVHYVFGHYLGTFGRATVDDAARANRTGRTLHLVMAKENTKNVAHAAQALFFAHSLTTHPDSNLRIDHVLRLPGFDVSSAWTRGLLTLFEPPVHLFGDFAKGFRGPALTDVLLSPQNPGQILSLPEEWFSHPHAADALRAATACANIECQAPHAVVSAAARARLEDIAHWLIFPQAAARGYTTKGTGLRAALLRRGGLRVIPDEGKILDELRRVVPAADVIQLETLSFAGQVARMRSTDLLIAPHGAGNANAAFMKPCSVLVEVFSCGHVLPYFATLAANANLIYIPWYDPACGGIVNRTFAAGVVGVANCVDEPACRGAAREAPAPLKPEHVNALVKRGLAWRGACLERRRHNADDDAVFLVQGYDPSRIPQICNKVETVRRVVRRVLVAGSRAGIVSLSHGRH